MSKIKLYWVKVLTGTLTFFNKIRLALRKKFSSNIDKKLKWKSDDFETGKGWAMSRPHPYDPTKTLWDFLTTERDSLLVIHELNKAIRNEKDQSNHR
jgi:hypothetical protein